MTIYLGLGLLVLFVPSLAKTLGYGEEISPLKDDHDASNYTTVDMLNHPKEKDLLYLFLFVQKGALIWLMLTSSSGFNALAFVLVRQVAHLPLSLKRVRINKPT